MKFYDSSPTFLRKVVPLLSAGADTFLDRVAMMASSSDRLNMPDELSPDDLLKTAFGFLRRHAEIFSRQMHRLSGNRSQRLNSTRERR